MSQLQAQDLDILSHGNRFDTPSTNRLVQGSFTATAKRKPGTSYGTSRNRDGTPAAGGLESNANPTVGGYHSLTPGVTLALELGQTRSEAFDGAAVEMNGASFGSILSF